MKDVSTQRQSLSRISQQQHKLENVFFAALNVSSIERVWSVWVLGSRISSRWGCTDLEGHVGCPEPNLGLTSLCLLTSIIQSLSLLTCGPCYGNESRWCFTPRNPYLASVRVWCAQVSIGIPSTAVVPGEGTEIWFYFLICFDNPFVVLFWASGRTENGI